MDNWGTSIALPQISLENEFKQEITEMRFFLIDHLVLCALVYCHTCDLKLMIFNSIGLETNIKREQIYYTRGKDRILICEIIYGLIKNGYTY
jgi:hypothetical protein